MWKELVTTMQIACTCNVEIAFYDNAYCLYNVHVTWKELVTRMPIASTCHVERACYDNANCLYM